MNNADNSLGFGGAGKLWGMIDPTESNPDIYQMLLDIPGGTIKNLIQLCDQYSDDALALDIVRTVASDEATSRIGANHGEIGAFLHLVAVVAPVISAFAGNKIRNEDGSVVEDIVTTNLTRLIDDMNGYWGCAVEDFKLSSANRFFFVRGWVIKSFISMQAIVLDSELDKHLMWVGSMFDYLKNHPEEVVQSDFTHPALEAIIASGLEQGESFPHGYERDGFYSISTESSTQDFLDIYSGTVTESAGVEMHPEELLYLYNTADGDLNEEPFMRMLQLLTNGLDVDPKATGKLALLLRIFQTDNVNLVLPHLEEYSAQVRSNIFEILSNHVATRGPLNAPMSDENFVNTIIYIAPVIQPFFEASIEKEGHSSLWDFAMDCYRHIAQMGFEGEDINNPDNAVMLVRASALLHFINPEYTDTEGRVYVDVKLINDRLDDICRNASLLMESRSLSEETIQALPSA